MKVLIVSPQFKPLVGGYERAAERLAGALSKNGHQVTVVTERRERAWAKVELLDGFTVRRTWCVYRRGLHLWTSVASLTLSLIRHGWQHDVWHIQQYGIHAIVATGLSRLLRIPVVVRATNTGSLGLAAALTSLPAPVLAKRLLGRADAFIALTGEMHGEIEAIGIEPGKIHLIGNAVSTELFVERTEEERQALRAALGLPQKKTVIFTGRLSLEKAPDELLRAWSCIREDIRATWQLVIVGEGSLRSALERQAQELSLTDSVTFAGYRQDVDRWLGAADIFVQSSLVEGMSNALLEAMATGLPVVTTAVSGSNALVSETGAGHVVNISATGELACAIARLAADRDMRSKMGRAGRETVAECYSIETICRRHEELYANLIIGHNRPST